MSHDNRLTDELETALLRELALTWEHLDRLYFGDAMRPPGFDLSDMEATLARWTPDDRTIVFSRKLLVEQPWTTVVEVLKHEMAHQYVSEVLEVDDETAHGPAFREVCARHGIDRSASGLPGGDEPDSPRQRVIRRIQKLLALGDSPNEHEAQAAMRAARRMMLEHNIAWVDSEARHEYGFRQLGEPRLRLPSYHRILAGLLADHFFVRSIWVPAWIPERGRRGRVLEIVGSPVNLDTAEYVHAFLVDTGERLWATYRQTHDGDLRGVKGRYLLGMMIGFKEKLDAQRRSDREAGLVWAGEADLEEFVGRRHPRLRRSRKISYRMTTAWQRGKEAGRNLELREPLPEDPDRRTRQIEG